MSGVVKISDASTWMVADWVHDKVLEKLENILPLKEGKLRHLLKNGRTDRGVGYCDVRPLDCTQFKKFVEAVEDLHDHVVSQGPSSFVEPQFYPGYVGQIARLRTMFRDDPRATKLSP